MSTTEGKSLASEIEYNVRRHAEPLEELEIAMHITVMENLKQHLGLRIARYQEAQVAKQQEAHNAQIEAAKALEREKTFSPHIVRQ